MDIEAQTKDAAETQPTINSELPPSNTANHIDHSRSDSDRQPQATNSSERHTQQTADNSEVQSDENHGDSSNGLWSVYLTEAEKQDKQVIDSWKGDTDGILVFTGLFSATVAGFIIENYQNLSPDSGDTTNALLTQISQQLVNISNGTPLTSIATQDSQPFKPAASANKINVLWFLSLALSLNCALSATLMQQWARRYQELAQRRGSIHRRGRMRAYIFNGINRFKMARAVATMPLLLHISVFFFFAGLVDFLFPTYATVAQVTLGMFALAYAILTVSPTIYHNCPYGTPLSGLTWRIFHFSVFSTLWITLKLHGLFRDPDGLKWKETLERQAKVHGQWFLQGLRQSTELSAYKAKSTLITSALAWTLTALDDDKEIEDFTARVPGFFDSRVVPDATSAVLSLMSHQPNTDPIFGSRLYDLLKTCIRRTSLPDEKMRKDRLRACLNCLWYFGRAYNQLGASQPLPSYFPDVLASPEIIRCVQTEEDTGVRVTGRCYLALIVNKLAPDLESRTDPISPRELACLSAITRTKSHDVVNLLSQPGAIALANIISLTSNRVSDLFDDTGPSGVLDVIQLTLGILSLALPAQENAELQSDQTIAVICGLGGKFDHMLISRIHDFLNMCTPESSPLTEEVRLSCLRMCFKGLWYFAQVLNQPESPVPLPSYIWTAFSDPMMTRHIIQGDLAIRVMGHCIRALIINKLAVNIKSDSASDAELACLSAILDTEHYDVRLCHSQPGTTELVELANMASPTQSNIYSSDVLDVVQQTFGILSEALPPELITEGETDTLINVFNVTSSLTGETSSKGVLHVCMKSLWHFTKAYNEHGNSMSLPSYIYVAFIHPDMTRRIYPDADLATQVIRCCVGALVVNNLAANLSLREVPASEAELACLSAILGTKSHDTMLLLRHPGAIEFTNMVFLVLNDIYSTHESVPPDVLDVFRRTFDILSQALRAKLNAELQLNETDTLMQFSDGTPTLTAETFTNVLHSYLKNLWRLTRTYNERGSSVPLPSYIYIPFTNPEMARRIHQDVDLTTQVIGRCVGALVATKLATDLKLKQPTSPANDREHACLATILCTESRDVRNCLSQPGTVELVNMVSIAFSDVSSSLGATRVPSDARHVLQQTLGILSEALLVAQENTEPEQIARNNIFDDSFKKTIVSHLHKFLKMCRPGASPLKEEVRLSCLRMCLKVLWHCGKAYHQAPDPLPTYLQLVLASPEITDHRQTEQDPVIHMTARCFGSLIVSRLVNLLPSKSHVYLDGNAIHPYISAFLGDEHRGGALLPYQLHVINFRNIVSLVSDNIDALFPAAGMATDLVEMAEQTLTILADRFKMTSPHFIPVTMFQRQLLGEIAVVTNARRPYRLKNQTVETLEKLQEVLEKILPTK